MAFIYREKTATRGWSWLVVIRDPKKGLKRFFLFLVWWVFKNNISYLYVVYIEERKRKVNGF